MLAWQIPTLGEPKDVLVLNEVDEPTAGPTELVVRVLGAAAGFPDAMLTRGEYQIRPELPFTPGVEVCGTVVAMGSDVTGINLGDRVIGSIVFPHGALAEYAVMDARQTFPAPPELDDAEAAALYIAYQTGWFGLHRRAQLQAGETLLVHAAAGGVGSAAVQLGKAAGATVIGVVGGPEKAEIARSLGADVVIDRSSEDFVEAVKAHTGGRGADVIYDSVGGESYTKSTKCIAFEGRLVIVGFASGTMPTPPLGHALVKNYSIVGLHWGLYNTYDNAAVHECHRELSRLVAAGSIRPYVSERLSLEHGADAIQRLADGKTTGRVVITP